MDETVFYVTNEDGTEQEMRQLFNFHSDEYNKDYILYIDPNGDGEEVFVQSYDDEGHLFDVTDEKELSMIEEVLEGWEDYEQQEEQ